MIGAPGVKYPEVGEDGLVDPMEMEQLIERRTGNNSQQLDLTNGRSHLNRKMGALGTGKDKIPFWLDLVK